MTAARRGGSGAQECALGEGGGEEGKGGRGTGGSCAAPLGPAGGPRVGGGWGGVGRVFGVEVWPFWKLLELE